MLWLIINGVGPGYLWPGLARSGEIPSHGFVALAIASIAAFTALFLAGERVPRVLERIMWAMVAAALALPAAVFQIGRASRRERVCQFGLISGGAGSLKKK